MLLILLQEGISWDIADCWALTTVCPAYSISWHKRCCKSYQWWFPTSQRMEICEVSLASNGSFPRTDSLGGASYWQLKGPEELLTVFRPRSRRLDFIQHERSCFIYSNGLMVREECSLAAHASPVPGKRSNTALLQKTLLTGTRHSSSCATWKQSFSRLMLPPKRYLIFS